MATTSIAIPHEGQKEIAAQGWVVLLGRVLFALIFIMSGPNHFAKQTIAYAAAGACWLRWSYRSQDSWRLPVV